ncbi:hypothetical protein [Ruegeria sp.]|uniref:hypothetical protein n=1 Tax=Ruegeria sp. TaxID=1879320 RepID=UPI003C7EBD35
MADVQPSESLFKKKNNGTKVRLNFRELERELPELAGRITILRARIIELEHNFFRDSKWALDRFNVIAISTLVFPMFATVLTAIFALGKNPGLGAGWPISIALTALGTMVAASGHAFGWHKRYKAMLVAKWRMTALRTAIDQYLADAALAHRMSEGTAKVDWKDFSGVVQTWVDQFQEILAEFGNEYGSAISTPAPAKPKAVSPSGN